MLTVAAPDASAVHFIKEAFKHCKASGATGDGVELLRASGLPGVTLVASAASGPPQIDKGVVAAPSGADLAAFSDALRAAIAQHRHWERELLAQVDA